MTGSNNDSVWTHPAWIARTEYILDSYKRWTGNSLISRDNPMNDSRRLYEASFVVVAHGIESDPLLNYGNATALNLWEMTLDDFLGTPSRNTAEPVHRDERADLLMRTTRDGYIDNYSGIRIASTGRRFEIHKAVVWNVVDAQGENIGQAATFSDWTEL